MSRPWSSYFLACTSLGYVVRATHIGSAVLWMPGRGGRRSNCYYSAPVRHCAPSQNLSCAVLNKRMEGCPKISLVLSFMAAKPFSFVMHDNRVKERDDG